MALIETSPQGIFDGSRLYITHLNDVSIEEISIKARLHQKRSKNPFKRISLRKKKWVPFRIIDSDQTLHLVDIKVSHAAKLLGIKRSIIRRAAKGDYLEEMVIRSIWISHKIPFPEVQERVSITEESFDMGTESEKDVASQSLDFERVKHLCAQEGLKDKEFQLLSDYIHAHQNRWEEGNEKSVYLHRLDTGLPRSIFWIRGLGAYIKLKGSGKEKQAKEICRSLDITREEYFEIRRYLNKHRYYWDINPYTTFTIGKCQTGLARNLMFRSGIGLYIEDSTGKEWVYADHKVYENAHISKGTYKKVFKGIQLDTGTIVAIGSSGRMVEDVEIVPGHIGISDEEKYAHEILNHELINKGVIIEYKGVKVDPFTDKPIVKRALISDFCPLGNLNDNLKYLTFAEKVRIAKDILKSIVYLHTEAKEDGTTCWLHLDIKPKNILLTKNKGRKRAILCDFSFTGPAKNKKTFKGGTLSYVAPEVLSKTLFGETGTHTDIWEAGVTLYQLFLEDLPSWSRVCSGFELKSAFEEGKEVALSLTGLKLNPIIIELLQGMIRIDASKRLSAKECLEVLNRLQL